MPHAAGAKERARLDLRRGKIHAMKNADVIIIGAGAAGLVAAAAATAHGQRVIVLDMGNAPARKVAVSGGGRCNFTNTAAAVDRYFGNNPNFVRGALSRVRPNDILDWARGHNLDWFEKTPGQYFCSNGAAAVVRALMRDARDAEIIFNTTARGATWVDGKFVIDADNGEYTATSVIIATGGTSFATHGVSDIGYKIAKHFGHKIVPPRPALCGIATDVFGAVLAGISQMATIRVGRTQITDSLLFTHFGIGGPATYRATVRNLDDDIHIDLAPGTDVYMYLKHAKQTNGKKSLKSLLTGVLPTRVAEHFAGDDTRNIADYRDNDIRAIGTAVNDTVISRGTFRLHNLASAEVVRGGIDTREISSKTMESVLRPGLYFAGEVMDVAGDLGGFNLHWAWASGRVAGQNV